VIAAAERHAVQKRRYRLDGWSSQFARVPPESVDKLLYAVNKKIRGFKPNGTERFMLNEISLA
jgi:ribosomal protein L32E